MNIGFSRWTSYLVPLFHPPYRGNKKVSKSSYDPLVAAAARSEDSLPVSSCSPLLSSLDDGVSYPLSEIRELAARARPRGSRGRAAIVALRSPVAVP